MKIITILLTIFVLVACANNRARKNIAYGEVIINGGVYNNKEWKDKLIFKRTSWYIEASMEYDIMIHRLHDQSQFANWMGDDRKFLKECYRFLVALIYADFNAVNSASYLVNQIEDAGLREVSIPDFKANLKSHDNFRDWRLSQYKVVGFCQEDPNDKDLVISIPGFKQTRL